MSDHNSLKPRYSYYGRETPRESINSDTSWKSDVNLTNKWLKLGNVSNYEISKCSSEFKCISGEYYKKYEHDEIPVKDNNSRILNANFNHVEGMDSDRVSLTNSDLEKLENKIYKNISQELQTNDCTMSRLDSHIKIFKTTVQEIFDNFYSCMQDFEVYKKRFEEILTKNKEDSIADMEKFIKDMIHHIISSDASISKESRNKFDNSRMELKDITEIKAMGDASVHTNTTYVKERNSANLLESLHSVVESYKNDNYLTDSTNDDNITKFNSSVRKEDTLNIYLTGTLPHLHIKMNDRNLLSEINLKNPRLELKEFSSAENLNKLTQKRLEMEECVTHKEESQKHDREIPVKASFAKKNLCSNEDFSYKKEKEENKSFMSKICSYICKKLRKN